MSTFLHNVIFMLVLFTAQSLDKISVNPDNRISLLSKNQNQNFNSNSNHKTNNHKNNGNIAKSLAETQQFPNYDGIEAPIEQIQYNSFARNHQQQQQQHLQHSKLLRFHQNNNEAAYLLPLHPSMQQQLLLQQEFEQQKKHQDTLQNNGFTTPFQSLTSSAFDDDVVGKLGKSKQQQQQMHHNHGRYSPEYSQKHGSNSQSIKQINNSGGNNNKKSLIIPQKLPQPQAQRQSTQIEFHSSGGNSNINNNERVNSIVGGSGAFDNKFYHNSFHISDGGLSGLGSSLPKIPPFPAISAFNFFGGNKGGANSRGSSNGGLSDSHKSCGGILTARHGVVQTPNFPDKFDAPIVCVWIIDASEYATAGTNISIVVYLNQLYVLDGLKFTEYMYYSEDYKVPSHRIFELTEDDVTQVTWIQFQSQYLEIRFEMRSLDGTHLRTLNRFLDVYGFNITYEVDQVKQYQCNALKCHFLGHCYATDDFSSYYCSCFKGFKGSDCSRGPLCEQNYCENGGTCKQVGDVAVKCICPKGFKGNKCDIAEITEVSTSCSLSKSAQCHHLCLQNDPVRAMNNGCKCNTTKTSTSTNEKHTNRTGKTRFEVTIRLGTNLTALFRSVENADKKTGEYHLPTLLEKLMSRALRNFNITKVNDLELISNSSKRLDITFHFFGVKSDSNRIREAITRMVERGRLGNFTLVSNFHLFDENPPLHLQEIILNQKSPIRENTEFILSCVAQGSPKIQFHWYKDGIPVNASKATRDIWTVVLPPEQEHIYTSVLGVSKANRLDEGTYTCKVIDWGVEQCQSTHVYVQTPPHLIVDPASTTVYRGEALNVRCLSPAHNYNNHRHHGSLGYSWTRNGVLFQSSPNTSMWEDLYPDGSILKIKNIQKSAEYTCIVSNNVSPVSKSVYITVIDKGVIQMCPAEQSYNIKWQSAAPGAEIIRECPLHFEGYTRRMCEQRTVSNSTWLQPDFSNCVPNQLNKLFNEFRALTLGYQKTNCSTILKSCLEYTIKRHTEFYPGEAGTLMDLLQEVENYLKIKGTHLEREMAAEIILHILDKVMQNVVSLNSQQQIKKFQLLTQSAALNRETIAASQLATSTSSSSSSSSVNNGNIVINSNSVGGMSSSSPTGISMSSSSSSSSSSLLAASGSISSSSGLSSDVRSKMPLGTKATSSSAGSASATHDHDNVSIADTELTLERLNSFRIYTTSIKTLPFNLRIYGDDLFSDQLYLDIRTTKNLMNIMSNGTVFASVISYKNLTKFLPKTYYARGSDIGLDYMPASRIIATWLFQSNRSNDNFVEPLSIPMESGRVEIIFQHENVPKNTDWQPVCGHEMRTTYESTWRTDLCLTKNLMENMTRCICPLSGTFVVLLAKKNYGQQSIENRTSTRPIFVIISCGCCFLQSCTAFAILIPILYSRKCSITFLKMQFCTSTSTVMAIYLLGFLKLLPQDWHSIISSTLASLMILGLSTLVAMLLVIQSELVPKKFHITTAAAVLSSATATASSAGSAATSFNNPSSLLTITGGSVGGGGGGSIGLSGIRCTTGALVGGMSAAGGSASIGNNGGIRGAIGISWLFPILFAICSPLIYSIIGKWPLCWWLEYQSSGFILFIIVQGLLISLLILLFVTLLKKLTWMLKKHDKHNISIWRRIGLLYRTGIILLIRLSTDALFLIYLNMNQQGVIISHLFGVCCILLGFAILFCFVIKAEYSLRTSMMKRGGSGSGGGGANGSSNSSNSKDPPGTAHLKNTSTKTSLEDNYEYCSDSINSPLNFYSNEKEKDNESGPLPLTILSTTRCPLETLQIQQQQQHQQEQHKFQHEHQMQQQQHQQQTTIAGICKNLNSNGSSLITVGGPLSSLPQTTTTSVITMNGNNGAILGGSVGTGMESAAAAQATTMSTLETYLGSTSGSSKTTVAESHHEFLGVETLDILQGVSPDSIIGIRASKILSTSSTSGPSISHHQQQQHMQYTHSHNNASSATATYIIDSQHHSIPSSLKKHTTDANAMSTTATQTPKSQKRVTIVEEPKQSTTNSICNLSSNSNSMPSALMQHHHSHYKYQQQPQTQHHQQPGPTSNIILISGLGHPQSTAVGHTAAGTDLSSSIFTLPPIITITSTSSVDDSNSPIKVDPSGIMHSNKLMGLVGKNVTASTASVIQQQHPNSSSTSISCNSINKSSTNNNNSDNLIIGGGGVISSSGISEHSAADVHGAAGKDDNDDDDEEDGSMLDRITHDLDYLLNRTTEVPTSATNTNLAIRRLSSSSSTSGSASGSEIIVMIQTGGVPCSIADPNTDDIIPPPPLPPTSLPPSVDNLPPPPPPTNTSTMHSSTTSASQPHCRSNILHHEVIIEESEQE